MINIERPLKTIETPIAKCKVVIKEWLTGREEEAIAVPAGIKGGVVGDNGKIDMSNLDMSELYKSQRHSLIEAWVLSVDDSVEKIVDKILDLPNEDYTFVLEQIESVSNEYKKKAIQ